MTWSDRARQLRDDAYALYLAGRDPRTPRTAKILIACVVAYAASPIDLIPDFIPGIGLLDDLVLVPLGIALAIRMIPPEVWAESREVFVQLNGGTLDAEWSLPRKGLTDSSPVIGIATRPRAAAQPGSACTPGG